jgi:UDP-arabinose 4-epimerase
MAWRRVSVNAILVTGGAGYVGAHTCKALRKAGYVPVTVDNLSTGHERFVRWGPFIQADVRDSDAIAQAIRAYEVEAVLHFAASAYVGESIAHPQKYYENNVGGLLSLLRAMLQTGCRKIVFSSTCAVYGEPEDMPIRETAPKNPVNPYGSSKLMIERILDDYARAYGLESVALRYFNACGADPDGEIGELRDPETHLIPRTMMAIQGHITDFAVLETTTRRPTARRSETISTSPISPTLMSRACGDCAKAAAPRSSISERAAAIRSSRSSMPSRRKPANIWT